MPITAATANPRAPTKLSSAVFAHTEAGQSLQQLLAVAITCETCQKPLNRCKAEAGQNRLAKKEEEEGVQLPKAKQNWAVEQGRHY